MAERRSNRIFRVLLVAAGVLALAEIVIMILWRETWGDEFFAAFKGYLILKGELVPFQNGIFDYAPLTVVTYGAMHYLFGPSLFAARLLSAVFFAAALLLVFVIGRWLAGRWVGLAATVLVLSNLLLVGNYISATMYAWTLLLLLAVVWVEAEDMPRRQKTMMSAVFLALAILGRTNMIAAAGIYFLYLILIGAARRDIAIFLSILIAFIGAGYAPLILPNPSSAASFLLGPYLGFGVFASLPRPAVAQNMASFLGVLTSFFKEYYGYAALFIVAVVLFARTARQPRGWRAAARRAPAETLLIMLSLGLFAAHFCYWRIAGNLYYANYFIPLMGLAGVTGLVRLSPDRRLGAGLIAVVIALNFGANLYRTDVVSDPRDESDLHRVARGADFVRSHTESSAKILTFDNSLYHVFLADRRTFTPLMQRNFLFLPDADTEKVRQLGFYNFALLKEWAAHDAEYLAIHKERWPSSLTRSPFWGKGSEDTAAGVQELEKVFAEQYELIGVATNVYPRKYTEGNDGGTLELYRRIK